MSLIEVQAPSVGESITEVVIGEWLKQPGEWVEEDEPIFVVESDKVNMEVPAPQSGVLVAALQEEGETVAVGVVVAHLDPNAKPSVQPASQGAEVSAETNAAVNAPQASSTSAGHVMPAASRVMAERGLTARDVTATGPKGRILKEDALRAAAPGASTTPKAAPPAAPKIIAGQRETEVVKMSPIRRTVARRLLEAQQGAAILSTFNEVDMSGIMEIRKRYKEAFIDRHGVKLGFMSFFVKAVCEALKTYPAVNAQIQDNQIIRLCQNLA